MKNRKKQRLYRYRRKKSFFKIWLGSLLPLLALTGVVGLSVLGLVLSAMVNINRLRATENAMQLADLLGAQMAEGVSYEESRELLNLYRYDMVAAVYTMENEEIMRSDIGKYRSSAGIPLQTYEDMLGVIETEGVYGESAYRAQEMHPFGCNFWYDETIIAAGTESYVLRYGSVSAPYPERKADYHGMAFLVILFVGLFSLLPAGYYDSIYRERVRMEEDYRNTANSLAHDLKTPLMAVSGYAENLRENVHSEKREHYADAILQNVSHMNTLIENMLELAKLENFVVLLHREDIDLRELTQESINRLHSEIQKKELRIAIQGSLAVFADKALMQRALDNLIGNAVKYTPEKHGIQIRMGEGEYRITNTGTGATEAETGTGIGLMIVREIMKQHSFSVRVSSEEDCFSVMVRTDQKHKKAASF